MADNATSTGTQDAGKAQASAQADAATSGKAENKTFTEAEVQSRTSAAVNEAQKKWREQQDALLADKTKDAETKLAELQTKAAEAERYADFTAAGAAAGIRNLKAAYLVAKHGDYFDKKGVLELDRFRKENPEFFIPAANANAGAGAGNNNNAGYSVNDFIRNSIGAR